MEIRLLHDRVLLEPIEESDTTASGIVLASEVKESPNKGTVIAVGPGRLDHEGNVIRLDLKPGDTVLFQKYGPDEVTLEGKTFLIAESKDIIGLIDA